MRAWIALLAALAAAGAVGTAAGAVDAKDVSRPALAGVALSWASFRPDGACEPPPLGGQGITIPDSGVGIPYPSECFIPYPPNSVIADVNLHLWGLTPRSPTTSTCCSWGREARTRSSCQMPAAAPPSPIWTSCSTTKPTNPYRTKPSWSTAPPTSRSTTALAIRFRPRTDPERRQCALGLRRDSPVRNLEALPGRRCRRPYGGHSSDGA